MSIMVGRPAPHVSVEAYVRAEREVIRLSPRDFGGRWSSSFFADTAHELAEAYGVLLPDGSALRATVVIDPDGEVKHLSVSDNTVGRSPDETLRVLRALRTGVLCPVSRRPGQPTLAIAA